MDQPVAGSAAFDAELASLVGQLQDIEGRLQALTQGQIDAVLGPTGRAHLLEQAQQRLLASEDEQRRVAATQTALINALPAHVALIDAQGRIVSVNEAWKRFGAANGQSDSSFGVGSSYPGIHDVAGAPDAAAAAHGLRAVLAGQASDFSLEYPCHTPTEQRWYRMMVTPLNPGAPEGAVVMHVDISERVRAESALRDSEQRYRGIVEVLPDLVCTAVGGRISFINQAGLRLLRAQDAAQVLGQPLLALFAADGPTALRQGLRGEAALPAGAAFVEGQLLALDGSAVDVEVAASSSVAGGERVVQLVCRDLSERKQSELQRQRLSDRLTRTLESLTDGFMTLDRDWRVTYLNPLAERMLARPAAELLGEVIWWQFPGSASTRIGQAAQRAMDEQCAVQLVERVLPADRWYDLRIYGSPEGLAVYARDVTSQRRLAAQLEEERLRLVQAQAVARMGSWDTDLETLNVVWSAETHRIFETDAETFQPTHEHFLALVHPDDRAAVDAAFRVSFERHVPQSVEHRVLLPDGRIKFVEERWQVFRSAAGLPLRALGTCQDITERTQAEQDLRRSKGLIDLAGHMARLGAWSVELPSMAVRWSDVVAAIHEEVADCSPTVEQGINYYAPEHRETVRKNFLRCMEDGTPFDLEVQIVTTTGQRRWVRLIGQPERDGAGRIVRVQGAFQDISERKLAEHATRELNAELEARVLARTAELSRAREEAEQASHAKSAFLATMSHEIRTPMNGVIGMIDVLHQTSLQGYQVEMVDLIRDSAHSLLGIIEDILDFSKIEAGRMDIERAPLRLADLVENVCGMLDHMASKRDVRLAVFVDPAIPPLLVGDGARLRQVLVNLVGNAIKFCGGGEQPGQVAVRARLLHADTLAATVELEVADNGIGMDEATLARLFTPFSQADVSTTRRFGGTGLGLAISGTLVKLMGGEIAVRSTLGQGAAFTVRVTMPRAEGRLAPDPAAALVAGLRCCVVGSEAPLADDLAAYLAHAGVQVERAAGPAAASAAPLWLVLPGPAAAGAEALRAQAPGGGPACFVLLGNGRRRRPRVEAADLVRLDVCGLTRRTLYRVLALASGRQKVEASDGDDAGDRPELDGLTAMHRGLLRKGGQILVAEDNETNRKVIQQQLQLIGLDAEFADDGESAFELWRSGDFGLVFTDLHMPRMDGYALAALIRDEEQARGLRRTAIVALTANALRDEEQRCRDAGMDAYLSKPVRLARLQAAVQEWLPVAVTTLPDELLVVDTPEPAQPRVDLSVLKALVGDDEAVISEVLRAFRDSAAGSGAALARACATGDLRGVADAAHKLKSGARSIGALPLGQRCEKIEAAAEGGLREAVAALAPLFQADLQAVFDFLEGR
jgi:PAS domain S-box-containing protein